MAPSPEDVLDRLAGGTDFDGATGCWVWTRSTGSHGYGQLWVGKRNRTCHLLAWELLVGPVPEGLELDHTCRNPRCWNPDCLEPVTHAENERRKPVHANGNSVKTECAHGHPLTGDNVRIEGSRRRCRACEEAKRSSPHGRDLARERQRRYRARKRP